MAIAMSLVLSIISFGALAYHLIEGWGWLDSVYFATTTLTTVGYGDLHPATDAGKIFTIIYVLSGVAIAFYVLSSMGRFMAGEL